MSSIQMYCNVDFQAKLAASFAPSVVKIGKIFDVDERKYREMGLHFRHTDNINYFLTAAKFVGLPQVIGSKLFLCSGGSNNEHLNSEPFQNLNVLIWDGSVLLLLFLL